MKTHLILTLLCFSSLNSFSQDKDEIYEPSYIKKTDLNLNRFFLDGIIAFYQGKEQNKSTLYNGGFVGARPGLHFALNRSTEPFFFKLLLPEIIIFSGQNDTGVGGFLPGIGFGKQQNLTEKWLFQGSIMANCGSYLGISETHFLGVLVIPQVKFIYKELSFGLEGSFNSKKEKVTNYKTGFFDSHRYSGFYVGINLGYSFFKKYHLD